MSQLSQSSLTVSFKDDPAPAAPADPRKDLLLNGSIEKLPTACDFIEELLYEMRKYSDNDAYFLHIFPLFIDRVFGEQTLCSVLEAAWVRGEGGGWLKKAAESTRTVNLTSAKTKRFDVAKRKENATLYVTRLGMSDFAAKLLHLLVPDGPVSKAVIDDRHDHLQLSVSFDILPKKVKMKFEGMPWYQCVHSPNHVLYEKWWQRVNLSGRSITSENCGISNSVVNLSLQNYFFVAFFRYPTIDVEVFPQKGRKNDNISQASNNNMLNHSRWIRGNPYLYLLEQYLHMCIPVFSISSPASHEAPNHNVQFLQLAIDYWIDCVLVVKYDFSRASSHKEEYLRHNSYYTSATPTKTASSSQVRKTSSSPRAGNLFGPRHIQFDNSLYEHPASTDVLTLVNLSNKAVFPTRNTMQCIYLLVYHCMSSMSSDFLLNEINIQTSSPRYSLHRNEMIVDVLPLPWTMSALQQPVFDLLRVLFKADSVDKDIFLLGTRIWHLWLTPWRRVNQEVASEKASGLNSFQSLKKTVSESLLKDNILYDKEKWLYYVAANLHYYTTLFVLFVQSPTIVRDLNESKSSDCLNILSVTLNMYTSELKNSIDYLNKGCELTLRDRGFSASIQDMSNASALSAALIDCITLQDQNLFPGLAAEDSRAVVDYRVGIRDHSKTIIELLRGRQDESHPSYIDIGVRAVVDGFVALCGYSSDYLSDDKHQKTKEIEMKLRDFCGLKSSDLSSIGHRVRFRDSNVVDDADRYSITDGNASLIGTLTDEGRAQVLRGNRLCKKTAIEYRKDLLTRPLLSTDIKFVVRFLVELSRKINASLDLPRSADSIYLSWHQMLLREVFRYESEHGSPSRGPIAQLLHTVVLYIERSWFCLRQGFRVNLRCLGNIVFISKLVFAVFAMLTYAHIVSITRLLSVSVVLYAILRSFGWHQM